MTVDHKVGYPEFFNHYNRIKKLAIESFKDYCYLNNMNIDFHKDLVIDVIFHEECIVFNLTNMINSIYKKCQLEMPIEYLNNETWVKTKVKEKEESLKVKTCPE